MPELDAAASALLVMLDPMRLLVLASGVVIGLIVGVLPGIGGITGLAILIPFTYTMDPFTAFAFLIGMASVTATGDTLPAVLFGVPGSAGSAATVMDGLALTRKGEAGRALGAGYAASLAGGIFGAFLLAVSIPILRPVMLYLGSPELLSFCVFGLSMVAVLSGSAPLKGLAASGIGLMIAMIGAAPQTGAMRWTFNQLYLWEGLPLVPITLGLFALPELCEIAVTRSAIVRDKAKADISARGQWQGFRDVVEHWWLVVRCSWIGSALGAVPGIGSAIIDWVAYGHASRTEKNADTFGKGDIRGVIASESANNAKEGGALVPTIAFGVPGSASMTLLLGAFLMHGLSPGPEMLTKHLDVTYSIIWSLTLANILGAGLCFYFSGFLARIVEVRFGLLIPLTLGVVFIGAFEGHRSWGDLYTLLVFGAIGWVMRQHGWPRPPLILGIVLGDIFERYLFISVQRYEYAWTMRPVVMLMFALALWGMYRPLQRSLGAAFRGMRRVNWRSLAFDTGILFTAGVFAVVAVALFLGRNWPGDSKIVPYTAGIAALIFLALDLVTGVMRSGAVADGGPKMDSAGTEAGIEDSSGAKLTQRDIVRRAAGYFGFIALFIALAMLIGFVPAIAAYVALFMRLLARESWRPIAYAAGGVVLFCWIVFDRLLHVPWPQSLLGDLLPFLREATGLI